jgi:ketosteroid isomerase-like protein
VSANLDLVRSIYADWERGDILTAAEWAHPEIEFVIADGPEPGSWNGLAGMAQAVRGVVSAYEPYRVEATEFRELGDERVLVLDHQIGRGKSGFDFGQVETREATLFQIRRGKVTRLVRYLDRDRASLGPLLAAWIRGLLEADLAVRAVNDRSGIDQLDRPPAVHRLEVLERGAGLTFAAERRYEHLESACGHRLSTFRLLSIIRRRARTNVCRGAAGRT